MYWIDDINSNFRVKCIENDMIALKKNILNLKILFGYFIILIVIGSVVSIILHEKQQLLVIEADSAGNRNIRHDIHRTYRNITELATLGESVISWEDADYWAYNRKRLSTDSLLQKLRLLCREFIRPEQVDTLRSLLASKEQHLFHIMQIFHKQEKADSLLMHRLPVVARQLAHSREITRKKKGIAGLLGKKETIQVKAPVVTLYALNEQLIEMQEQRRYELENYTDTLKLKNKILNNELMNLISQMDTLTQSAFQQKEQKIEDMRQSSFRLMSYVLAGAILLLFVSYLVIQRDLRQKEKSRRALEESIRQNKALLEMRKKIILTISHDIRGPLGSINGSAELAMDTREKKKRNNHLENIRTSCRHILHLVNNLLDIYRMNEWKETRNDIPFRLDRFIERIIDGYLHKSNDKGLLFTTELTGMEATVIGDADRIEQILNNLLMNAVKFTETGEIRFIASYENGELTIEVRDTGIGMSEETLSRIFLPFERAAQSVNSEGFGLGLSITKGLVELLGGRISVESSTGKGSVFRVTLPLCGTEEREEAENKSIVGSLRLPREVLVVDDDSVQLEVIKEMLERNGVYCEACRNAKEVVQVLRKRDFDLILTDVQMPGTDGFNLLKLLRNSQIGTSQTVPVMVMTARGDKDTTVFTEAGFRGCIYKPFSAQELLSFISSVVRQENEESNEVSFDALISETNDKEKMLELFVGESERSIAELQDALRTENWKRIRETVHRMLPLWEMLYTDNILQEYRRVLHDEHTDMRAVREETKRIITHTHELIMKAKNEIARMKNETEDTDS